MSVFRNLYLPVYLSTLAALAAQTDSSPPADNSPIVLDRFVVTDKLDKAREAIVPSLGATSFGIDQQQILALPQGEDAPINQILLRAPGVAGDSAVNGDLHIRGEHANLQYRINGVLLPEGITGFGLELDSRFINSMQLVTGSLPAEYGFRTAGIVDIQTKGGSPEPGGGFSVFGGSFDSLRPSFETGGSAQNFSYFVNGSYDRNGIGIENPTASAKPIHDTADQNKLFSYMTYLLDDKSRVSAMVSASDSTFQVPNTPGLAASTAPNGNQWLPGIFDSTRLNERQNEQNYYGVISYQRTAGDLNYQVSAIGRKSSVHFMPDPVGDLYFNGVASDVSRKLHSAGLQGDSSYALTSQHMLRSGFMALDEYIAADTTTAVFPVDSDGNPTGPAFSIADNHKLHGLFAGLYLQDEWKIAAGLTLNYGARYDIFNSSFDHENQFSPRLNFIYKPADSTAFHAGYSRYFTPPPVENVSGSTVAAFDHTSNAAASDQADPVKTERSDYFDAGISQTLAPGFQVGLDGYYKRAKNQLDDGLFGQTLILSAFNYAQGKVYGLELTTSYTTGGFSTYANLAHSVARGRAWSSSQFLFDPADVAYVQNHWIALDHDQTLSGSFGASYHWDESSGRTQIYLDAIYGSGLRTDATAPDGSNIPNGGTVPSYYSLSVGVEQTFKINARQTVKARLDVVNLTDKSYELRDGTGVGVGAPQYGPRRGFYGTLTWAY